MNNLIALLITLALWLLLAAISYLFNAWIDRTRPDNVPDGVVGWWVMGGCTYVLIAFLCLFAVWWPQIKASVTTIDAVAGVALLAFGSFAFAGVPMVVGDARRSLNRRKIAEGEKNNA